MRSRPLISVIIPVFNCEKYISEAIESVVCQTYDATEIIVVDDGSNDGSHIVATQFGPGARVFRQDHMGIGAARNHGIKQARGNFLAFLDADDIWHKNKLELQMDEFERNSETDMVFGYFEEFISPDLDEATSRKLQCHQGPLRGIFAGTLLIRRASFERIGFFEEKWRVGEFVDWYAKAVEKGLKHVFIEKTVMKRRLHRTNTGIVHRDSRSDYLKILKASLDRRRQPPAGPKG